MTLATEAYFTGRWQMVRLIESPTGGPLGEFWGEAVFAPAGPPAAEAARRPEQGRVDATQGLLDGPAVGLRELTGVVDPGDGGADPAGRAPASTAPAVRDGGDARPPDVPERWLRCAESGVLRYQGQDYAAGRGTFWRFEPGGTIQVTYEDGRPFHRFAPDDPEATHLCGDDTYDVEYDFAPDLWWSRWRVIGPHKDYWMTTRYVRIPEPG